MVLQYKNVCNIVCLTYSLKFKTSCWCFNAILFSVKIFIRRSPHFTFDLVKLNYSWSSSSTLAFYFSFDQILNEFVLSYEMTYHTSALIFICFRDVSNFFTLVAPSYWALCISIYSSYLPSHLANMSVSSFFHSRYHFLFVILSVQLISLLPYYKLL